jgi:DnaJ-class molecular chaperone
LSELAPLEIQALSKIMDELDYYQILHLERDASVGDVKKAFHATSRTFHPDVNRHLEAELLGQCSRISKRVTEAYCVLRDPRRRQAYDERLNRQGDESGLRMQLAEAKAAHARQQTEERQGKTPQGRQFHQKAMQDIERDDLPSAVQNLQMALTFEAGNDFFKEKLAELKAELKARR